MATKQGRHPLPADARRSQKLNLRLTVGEVDQFYRQALRNGRPLSEMLRLGMARLQRRPPRPPRE